MSTDPQTSSSTPIILGRPFLTTSNAIINCRSGQLRIEFGNMTLDLNIFNACKLPNGIDEHEEVCCIGTLVEETFCSEFDEASYFVDFEDNPSDKSYFVQVGTNGANTWMPRFEPLPTTEPKQIPSTQEHLVLDLKPLPEHLKYAFLGEEKQFPMVISSNLTPSQEIELLDVLKQHKTAIGWTIGDIKGINPHTCMHHIYLEDDTKPTREMQRRLNPTLK